jgi:AraC-like DNA-binding protein
MILYKRIAPVNKALLPYIETYLQVSGNGMMSRIIFPQSGIPLVFDFDHHSSLGGYSYNMVVIGQQEKPLYFNTQSKTTDKLIINFSSYGLSVFLKTPVYTINNQLIPAEDIFGTDISILYDSLSATSSLIERIQQVELFLLARLQQPSDSHKMIFALAEAIKKQANSSAINNLKKSIPLSTRQVERNFRKIIGTDISQYVRIARFEKAIAILQKSSFARLTDVSYEAGYYDQSHFINDFKTLTGISPGRLQFCS